MQVIEKFTSINGEGLKQGELAVFIRFAGCNLRCSYCDTRYSFENPKFTDESVEEIMNYVRKANVKNITITGGEPLLQKNINELLEKLTNEGYNVEIETNGSINIKDFVNNSNISYTLDYKLPVSLMEKHMDTENYKYITKKDSVKFVCGSDLDLKRVKEIIDQYDLTSKTNCIISPVFNMIKLESIVGFMKDNNLNNLKMQIQIHKVIWDPNERGV